MIRHVFGLFKKEALTPPVRAGVSAPLTMLLLRRLMRHRRGRAGFLIVTPLLLLASIGPILVPAEALQQNLGRVLQEPSLEHWLGTDQAGRDYFARLVLGLQTSWSIVLVSTLAGMTIGVATGIAAGFYRGVWEAALLRLVDLFLSVPNLVLALVIAALMGAGATAVIVALTIRGFPPFARTAHATTRSLMTQEFVESGVVLGADSRRLLLHYLLPNVLAPSLILFPILIAGGLLIAASLSFFGLGVQPPESELGLLVSEGRRFMHLAPVLLWAPGVLLTVNNVGLSLLSDGLRVALDPLQRETGALRAPA